MSEEKAITFVENLMQWALASLPNLVAALAILVAGYVLGGMASRSVGRVMRRIPNSDVALQSILGRLAKYSIIVLALIAALGQLGLQLTSFLAALGAIGLAIGLALQGTLSNVAAGVMLLWLRPFRVGDVITSNGATGKVDEIGLFATRFTTLEGYLEFVPNGQIWNARIANFTINGTRMVREIIGIGYGDDIAKAKSILLKLGESDARFTRDPEPKVLVSQLGDSSVNLEFRGWTTAEDWAGARFDFIENAKRSLDEAGISIPFPQRDVHLYNVDKEGD